MTTIEKIQEISKSIKDKSEELIRLLCSDDVVCWMTEGNDNIGKKIDGEYAHSVVIGDILGWNDTETCYIRTPAESLKYEIEVEKMRKKNCEDNIIYHQERIDEFEKELKEMENKDNI